jgi:FG-GAP repeat
MRRVVVVFVLVLAGALVGAPRTVVQAAPAAPTTDAGGLRADFNHDGFADLAVGVPRDRPGDIPFAGAVNVLYGSAAGLSGSGSQYFTQNTPGVASSAERYDAFGAALAGGDFDNDGASDLAVGAPREDLGGIPNAGAVNVLYGSAGGLSGTGSQFFTQGTPGVGGRAEGNDLFGSVLAASGSQSGAAAAALLSGSRSGAQSMTPRR